MDVYVLDTTAVTEARLRRKTGAYDLSEIVLEISGKLREARLVAGAKFYMTPSTWSELRRMLLSHNVGLKSVEELGVWITIKAPNKLSLQVPATVFSEYVADVRRRLYKGLRVSEALLRKVLRECDSIDEAELIRSLREKYREATRKGLVDSIEDIDTILLAQELQGVLVTSDEGMKRLAEQLGIIVVDPEDWLLALDKIVMAFKYFPGRGEANKPFEGTEE